MKLFKLPILYSFIVLLCFSGIAQTTSFSDAKQKGSATLEYFYVETPGFIENSGGGQKGICADILTGFESWVKSQYGITLNTKYVPTPKESFPTFMNKVKSGGPGVIGVGGVTITEARKKSYSFSYPYINNISILATNSSVPTISNPSEISSAFANMTALSVKGTTNEKALLELKKKYFPNMKIEYLSSNMYVSKKIAEDPKYFSIVDLGYFLASLKEYRSIKRQPAMDEANETFGFVMPKGSDWEPILSKYLKEVYLNSPQHRKSIATHLGPSALKLLDSYAN
ncbi:transporter substrate-binding domain-containing protein [Mangrovivirga sp. M17]|uniref:Transporter substrate-binding domain-containing protein n=1 Tax=Mangrovivirga halotolerans TaxID=2993936 RepID=A0ABT3RWP9_9BACT|nr:transporter substrate-binding domain-containing protein [Mangrovivirga halotolerans]MCX2745956.1 transporter substrate-binding domain-containing protein [Mangrovivirga halotolerans]